MPAPRLSQIGLLTLVTVFTVGPHAFSQTSLRYQPKPDGPFAYQMEISVELPDKISQFKATARVWTDASGEHRIEATYLGFTDGNVQLKRTDGKEIAVPLDKLSAADQQVVKQLQTVKKKTPNPFE